MTSTAPPPEIGQLADNVAFTRNQILFRIPRRWYVRKALSSLAPVLPLAGVWLCAFLVPGHVTITSAAGETLVPRTDAIQHVVSVLAALLATWSLARIALAGWRSRRSAVYLDLEARKLYPPGDSAAIPWDAIVQVQALPQLPKRMRWQVRLTLDDGEHVVLVREVAEPLYREVGALASYLADVLGVEAQLHARMTMPQRPSTHSGPRVDRAERRARKLAEAKREAERGS
jgi:hypothetical protein